MSTATITNTETETNEKTGHYPRYKVFAHNDEKTTMDFVVYILHTIFGLKIPHAHQVMLEVHHKNVGFVGAYTMEQAEFRIEQAHSMARAQKFPLKFTMEPE